MRHKNTQEEIHAAEALIGLMAERWPKCFAVYEGRRKPLKIGIHHDIDVGVAPEMLSLAMRLYTNNVGYLRSMRAGAARIDLEGNAVGTVSDEDVAHASRTLEHRAARKARQPAPVPAPAPEPTPPKRLTLADLKEAARLRKQKALEQGEAA